MHTPAAIGDIRHQQLHMLPVDVTNLWTNEYLSTNLVDFLLQNVLCTVQTNTDTLFVGPALFPTRIALAEYEVLLESRDTSRRTHTANVRRVERRKEQLKRFSTKPSIFLAPVIELDHFFVLYIKVDPSAPSSFKEIHCFDSFIREDSPPSKKALAKKVKALDTMEYVNK